MADTTLRMGGHRSLAWFEPTFDPQLESNLVACDWSFLNSSGPCKSFLSAVDLMPVLKLGQPYKIENKTFDQCDIQGDFSHRSFIEFRECHFKNCDFAYSSWEFTYFKSCSFSQCSISLSSFTNCEFRNCDWVEIGFSGSKTQFVRTLITNPSELLGAGFSGINRETIDRDKNHKAFQRSQLEQTKAHLARVLMASNRDVGDDKVFYETARLRDVQQLRWKVSEAWFNLMHGHRVKQRLGGLKVIFRSAELGLLWTVGSINGWGAQLLQPLIYLVLNAIIFAEIYNVLPLKDCVTDGWQKSFDISVLAGYTNQSHLGQSWTLRLIEDFQLCVSILLYTSFFASIVSRMSRIR